jgi:hypothetical protein
MMMEVKYLWRMCFLSPNLIFKLRFSNFIEILITCDFPPLFSKLFWQERKIPAFLCVLWRVTYWLGLVLHQWSCQEWGVEETDKNWLLIQSREFLVHVHLATPKSEFIPFHCDTSSAIFELW